MTIGSTAALSHSVGGGNTAPDPKIAKAASEFEALFVAQMLRSAREAGAGAFGNSEGDQSSGAMMEMAEDQLAQALSSGGGLGLARTIAESFRVTTAPPPDPNGLKIGLPPAVED
jgi:Rod binding domain-containing protein